MEQHNSEEDFFKSLPKIELHAHLNGSVSPSTMEKLLKYHRKTWPDEVMPETSDIVLQRSMEGSLEEPFAIFPIIHSITDNTEAVRMVTHDVIRDFYDDGVKYLELRSTPRHVEGRMTKLEYCQSVVLEIINTKENGLEDIDVKFLLSIDRRKLECFDSTVQLYFSLKEKYPDVIVGLDISGDPRVGDITQIIPKLQNLRANGVKVTIHLAEIVNIPETLAFLKYVPDRIGHGTYIHPSNCGDQQLLDELIVTKTPVEVCLTSNIVSGSVPCYSEHHAKYLREANIPIILCTDDKGVFSCTLSGEYRLASEHLGWSRQELFNISLDAISHVFRADLTKERLVQKWMDWRQKNCHYF